MVVLNYVVVSCDGLSVVHGRSLLHIRACYSYNCKVAKIFLSCFASLSLLFNVSLVLFCPVQIVTNLPVILLISS